MLVSVSASAQFVQSTGGSKASSSASVEDVFSTFDFTYSPVTYKFYDDPGESKSEDLNGLSLNWAQARLVTSQLPIYLQYGAGLQYTWKTDIEEEGGYDYSAYSFEETISFLTVKIPVNVLYNFAVPNTSVSVMPYMGLSAQFHVLGQTKYTYTAEYDGEKETEKINLFSEDDMDDAKYNRFCLGWQIGAMVAYDKYFVGVGYQGPVTNLWKDGDYKINTSQVNISLGIKF